jgi:hypothetical protein
MMAYGKKKPAGSYGMQPKKKRKRTDKKKK